MAVRLAVVGAWHELRHLRLRPIPELVYGSPSGPPVQPDMVEVRSAGDGEGRVELGYAEQCPEGQKGKPASLSIDAPDDLRNGLRDKGFRVMEM
ncbi:hypothetical protein BHE74_00003913 [Ensete ventricosum]|nr:hypothetical protein GW17_00041786 [Ensete ventricosum]RWW87278.1 hypothetical protein BHE74_00003913 [Ensete ventricosum]RZR81512.1 hypothetical protein BHM03_00007759 [Ensete ventricosum]